MRPTKGQIKTFIFYQLHLYYQFKYQKMSLKQQMLTYFQQPEINQKIIDYVARNNLDINDLQEETLLKMIDDLGLLQEIQEKVEEESIAHQSLSNMTHHLNLTITKGRKFKSFLDLPRPAHFYFILSAFGQKVKGSMYEIAQNFSILQKLSLNLKTAMLKSDNSENLELIVVVVIDGNKKWVYSIKFIEWRFVLVYGSLNIDIQLAPYYHQGVNTLPSAGILSISLKINPLPKHFFLSQPALNRQLQFQQKSKESSNNKFHSYANSFWNEIKSVHRSLQTRRVPIYAQTQDKIYYALPKLIKPLFGIRGIESPHHALRFCSLIPFSDPQYHREKAFRRFSTVLAANQGSVEDHCHLLCSLLLGMGQKAYVCVGTISKGQHSWVMSQSANSITFWQCTKGIKLDFFSPKSLTYYKTINAVYNHKQYYANLQLDDSVSGTKFNFKDATLWKKMDQGILQELNEFNRSLSLSYPSLNCYQTEQNIEVSLLSLISDYRTKLKLSYNYDDILASLLSTALSNYEIERVTGSTFCEQQFQFAIKNYIPAKHTFKAFPIQLTTMQPKEIFAQLIEQPKSKQILQTKGQSLYFAIRTKLVIFPDNIFALWLSLAVRYYRLD